MTPNNDTTVKTTALAAIVGVSARRIQQLAQDGVLESDGKGQFKLYDSVQRFIEMRSREKELTKSEKDRDEAEVSMKKAKAIVAVLEAKELQGKMHRSEDLAAFTEDLIFTIRGMLLALPGRLAVDAAATSTAADAAELIRQEVYKVMEELSRYKYDARKYEERVRERRKWDSDGAESDDE